MNAPNASCPWRSSLPSGAPRPWWAGWPPSVVPVPPQNKNTQRLSGRVANDERLGPLIERPRRREAACGGHGGDVSGLVLKRTSHCRPFWIAFSYCRLVFDLCQVGGREISIKFILLKVIPHFSLRLTCAGNRTRLLNPRCYSHAGQADFAQCRVAAEGHSTRDKCVAIFSARDNRRG